MNQDISHQYVLTTNEKFMNTFNQIIQLGNVSTMTMGFGGQFTEARIYPSMSWSPCN